MSDSGTQAVERASGAEDEVRIGDRLRDLRRERGLSVSDISRATGINEDYIKAMEAMYAAGVPKGYLSVYLRSYAGHLKLPSDEVITTFKRQCGMVAEAARETEAALARTRRRNALRAGTGGLLAATLIVGAGAAIVALARSSDGASSPQIAAGNGVRDSLFESAETARLEPQLPLSIRAKRAAWLEVRGKDGTVFRSRTMAAGEVYYPRIGAGWTVSARDGEAFEWQIDDEIFAPLAERTGPVYTLGIDPVALAAQSATRPALAQASDGR